MSVWDTPKAVAKSTKSKLVQILASGYPVKVNISVYTHTHSKISGTAVVTFEYGDGNGDGWEAFDTLEEALQVAETVHRLSKAGARR